MKNVPNNTGKEYFRWNMTTRNLLLREAHSREPWMVSYKERSKAWTELTTILKSIPSLQEELATLDYWKRHKEFITNDYNYFEHRDGWTFKSGDAEQHIEWQDIMEDIV